ncbi:hypothetical protein M3J09_007514 [Ascochyta lentis]
MEDTMPNNSSLDIVPFGSSDGPISNHSTTRYKAPCHSNIEVSSNNHGIDVQSEAGRCNLSEPGQRSQAREKAEVVGTTTLSDKGATTIERGLQMTGYNVGTDLADTQTIKDEQAAHHWLPNNSQNARTETNNGAQRLVSIEEGKLPLPEPGVTKIEGYFPYGANLEVSTADGATVIVDTRRATVISTVAGPGAFQFVGDPKSLHSRLHLHYQERRRRVK